MVKVGSTSVSVARAATVASAVPVPSALKRGMLNRKAPISRASPTIPLVVIMTAAKTVSRASDAVSGLPEAIKLTIRPTSMIVTATARITEPNGSPTRWATTSAWCTAASTAAPSVTATTATTTYGMSRPQVRASSTRATTGTMPVQDSSADRAEAAMGLRVSQVLGEARGKRSLPRYRYRSPMQYADHRFDQRSVLAGKRWLFHQEPRGGGRHEGDEHTENHEQGCGQL